jgi:hypothetical protein
VNSVIETISYGISSFAYLRRARARLNEGTPQALFYAAFELRAGTESRLQDYLDARDDVAKHKKQGWKIIGSAKELDRRIGLGDKIVEARFLDESGNIRMAVYYTPITARLREAAGARLHDLTHAMKKAFPDDDRWWNGTRTFLEQIYSDLEFANKGTLLGPILLSPDRKHFHMSLSIPNDSPIADRISEIGQVGRDSTIGIIPAAFPPQPHVIQSQLSLRHGNQ